MTEPQEGMKIRRRWLNPVVLALFGGVILLLGLIWFFGSNRNPDQDKLADNRIAEATAAPAPEKRCSASSTYEIIKRELFRRAAEQRGSDQAAYDRLAGAAFIRMENPVMESEDSSTGAINCSGSVSLDLPPGVAVAGGRHTLTADVDYTINGDSVVLHNADAIIAPLATLARVAEPQPAVPGEIAPGETEANVAASESANVQPGPATSYPGRPSFDCARAETPGEIAVCSDSGLAALDLNMTTQYRRALTTASPTQLQLLRATRDRFLAFRDRCPNRTCMANAYLGRMREIRDIMEGRLLPPR